MIACGKRFNISEQQPKLLEDFQWQRRDRLICREFIGWWAVAFVGHHLMVGAWSLKDGVPDLKPPARRTVMAGAVAVCVVALCAGVLETARWYQAGAARKLLNAYQRLADSEARASE